MVSDPVVFRPRAARYVSWSLAVAVLALMSWMAYLSAANHPLNPVAFLALGLGICWFLMRQATVKLTCTADGLTVRNLWATVQLTWPQVVHMHYGPDVPWVRLDCSDGSVVPVMAIQNADGAYGLRNAQKLRDMLQQPPLTMDESTHD